MSAYQQVGKLWYIYTVEYCSVIKKNETLPFAVTWMDLEDIMLSEMSDGKTNTLWYHLNVEPKTVDQNSNITKKKHICRYRLQISSYQRGTGMRGGARWVKE